MMLITRTDSRIEVEIAESRRASFDVDRLTGAMLLAERAPCGRVRHALMLQVEGSVDALRIEGCAVELTEVHHYVVETMLNRPSPAAPC